MSMKCGRRNGRSVMLMGDGDCVGQRDLPTTWHITVCVVVIRIVMRDKLSSSRKNCKNSLVGCAKVTTFECAASCAGTVPLPGKCKTDLRASLSLSLSAVRSTTLERSRSRTTFSLTASVFRTSCAVQFVVRFLLAPAR